MEYLTLEDALDGLEESGFVEHFGCGGERVPPRCAYSRSLPLRRRGGGTAVGIRPLREILEPYPVREPSVFGSYNYGVPVLVPKDPWHDEGGESGPTR